MKFLGLFIFLLFFVACVTIGSKFNDEDLAKVKKGKTTLEELSNLLGKPNTILDSTNSPPQYYSKDCGKKDGPIKVVQYHYAKAGYLGGQRVKTQVF